ncbi:MAG TPA: hypothetical protein VN754_11925 [Candidatus Binataceae bacterium]|nr:hypothetical protein [Candidatus Binataceae bacterium]
MASSLQNSNRDEFTDVNRLLRNLIELVTVRDKRLAYLASASFERLAALRAAAAKAGFMYENLLNPAPLTTGAELRNIYRGLMDCLDELTDALRTSHTWQSLDPNIVEAGVRVQEAWRALKERDAV